MDVVGSVPGSGIGKLPPLGEGTVVAVMDPNLASAATVAESRGATVVKTLMPVGVDGTARFVQDVAEEGRGPARSCGRDLCGRIWVS